jgi:hypothetical protein
VVDSVVLLVLAHPTNSKGLARSNKKRIGMETPEKREKRTANGAVRRADAGSVRYRALDYAGKAMQ